MLLRHWHREEEGAARTHGALRPDPPPMGIDDSLGDAQAEPRATDGRALVGLPEPVEDPRHLVGSDAAPRVAHGKQNAVPLLGNLEANLPTAVRELERVADDVGKHLENSL